MIQRREMSLPSFPVVELRERLLLRTPVLGRVQLVCVRANLDEFEKIPVDDEFDLSSEAIRSGGLSAHEVRELIPVVDKVVASTAVPHVQIADNESGGL